MALVPPTSVGGGSSTSGAVLLFDSTLGADTATIDTGAAGIASGYKALQIWVVARTDQAAAAVNITVTLNNDSSAVYDNQQVNGSAGAAGAGQLLAQTSWALTGGHGASGSANYPGILRMTIPAYDQTTFHKVGEAVAGLPDSTGGNNFALAYIVGYRSATAISRMAIGPGGGTVLKAGSRLTIFGLT